MGNEVANSIIILCHTFSVRFEDIEEACSVDRAHGSYFGEKRSSQNNVARSNELDIPPKRTNEGAIRYVPYPNLAK